MLVSIRFIIFHHFEQKMMKIMLKLIITSIKMLYTIYEIDEYEYDIDDITLINNCNIYCEDEYEYEDYS